MPSTTTLPANYCCPRCGADLVTAWARPDQPVLCAACGSEFVLRQPGFAVRTSRLAIASLVLGLCSLIGMCITGLPAIVAGIVALREIRRGKGALSGTHLAWSGIATGGLLGFFCAPVSTLLLPAFQLLRQSDGPQSSPQAEQSVERLQLENGLTVLLRPVRGTSQTALVVLYSIGEDHDPQGKSGLAHLIEHVYVTSAAGEIKARTAEEFMGRYPAGGNAQTGDRYTVIATVFPKADLDAELKEAGARMQDLRITADDLEREKRRVIDEVANMFGGNPQLIVQNQARERIRPSRVGGRKGGLPDQVAGISLEELKARWERFYKPSNATLVLAGAIDRDAAREAVTRHFGPIPAGTTAPDPVAPDEARFGRIDDIQARPFDPAAAGAAALAYPAPPRDSEVFPAFLVLAARLASRSQFQEPRQPQSQCSILFDDSALFVTAGLKPEESSDAALARLDTFVAKAVEPPLAASDVKTAKNQFALELGTSALADSLVSKNLYGLAACLGRRAQLGFDPTDFAKALDAVTADQLASASRTIFSKDRRVAVVARPKPK
jgi:zinc protease